LARRLPKGSDLLDFTPSTDRPTIDVMAERWAVAVLLLLLSLPWVELN
jgi:hypothetical protein